MSLFGLGWELGGGTQGGVEAESGEGLEGLLSGFQKISTYFQHIFANIIPKKCENVREHIFAYIEHIFEKQILNIF